MEQSTPVTLTESQKNQLKNRAQYYLNLAARADKGEIGFRESDPALDMGYHAYLLAQLVKDILDPAPVVPAVEDEPDYEEADEEACDICGDPDCPGIFDPEDCPEFSDF